MPDNATIARSFFEAWEKRDFDALGKYFAEGVSFNDPPRNQVIKGKKDLSDFYESWALACPDSTCGATVIAASGDTVAVEGVWVGTNSGPFGPFPATGRSVSMPWVNVLRFNGEGQITDGAGYYDQLTPLTQLGHMRVPSGA